MKIAIMLQMHFPNRTDKLPLNFSQTLLKWLIPQLISKQLMIIKIKKELLWEKTRIKRRQGFLEIVHHLQKNRPNIKTKNNLLNLQKDTQILLFMMNKKTNKIITNRLLNKETKRWNKKYQKQKTIKIREIKNSL